MVDSVRADQGCAFTLLVVLALTSEIVNPSLAHAATCGDGASPDRREDSKIAGWAVQIAASRDCRGAAIVDVLATRSAPSEKQTQSGGPQVSSSNSILSIPIACRRDDYMFLPPDALGGIPCISIPMSAAFDPQPLAVQLAQQLPPPDLRIRMNPTRGMVNIPTWFWAEGYDGGTLSQSQTVLQEQVVCHLVTDRGPGAWRSWARTLDRGRTLTARQRTPRLWSRCA